MYVLQTTQILGFHVVVLQRTAKKGNKVRCWAHAPAIHATSHVDHEKMSYMLFFYMHAFDLVSTDTRLCLELAYQR